MPFETRVALTGSERKAMPEAHRIGPVQEDEPVRVTVILNRKKSSAQAVPGQDSETELNPGMLGANPEDIETVERFAHEFGLTIEEASAVKRRVILAGTAGEMTKAFGTSLECYRVDTVGPQYRGRTGTLTVPEELQGKIMAVIGLDNRPTAKPHFRMRKKAAAPAGTFTPPQLAKLYNFPTGVDGTGQTIAIIELGGGYRRTDLKNYFKNLGIKEPAISAVSVDHGKNKPGSDADGEVMLDIEVAGAIAHGAKIAVYFAPNTDQGFIDAITDAAHDTTRKPSVISISWGGAEDSWTEQARTAMNAALQDAATLGVTVTVASGDDGSTDGQTDGKLHVDFPASSPFALACGGTTLKASGTQITSETVWNEIANQEGAGGGGISVEFGLPAYQSGAGVPVNPQTKKAGRGVPDVAGDADPSTGYEVLVDGQSQIVGGTSAVAPLWAALVAIMNQKLGKPVGFLNPKLYSIAKTAFHDITSGNNDSGNLGHYSAGSGWDPCTGLGSPNGAHLLAELQASSTTSNQVTTGVGSGAAAGKRSA